MFQRGSARLCTMIHRASLSMELLLRLAPLPSAGKWLPNFAVFRKLVWPSHTLFSAIDIARTHGHWLIFLYLVFISHAGHAVANSFTVHRFLFVFHPWWQGFQLAWPPIRLHEVLGQGCSADASRASRFRILAHRQSSRSHGGALERSSSNSNLPFSRLSTRTQRLFFYLFFVQNILKRFQRAGGSDPVDGPGSVGEALH